MTDRDPIRMAIQIAGLRAAETHLPESEREFQDPYAEYFLPEDARQSLKDTAAVKAQLAGYEKMLPGVNGSIVARIKFIDDALTKALNNGFSQVVILGAGFDTRAYRLAADNRDLRFFEVDHPTTQRVKVDAIERIFGRLPDQVVYVPLVIGGDSLEQTLSAAGYARQRKTFFIAEGLLMYLPPDAVDALLSFIVATSGASSTLVADCFNDAVVDGSSPLPEARALKGFVEREGSPLRFGISEDAMEAFFLEAGFKDVSRVSPQWCKERLFTNTHPGRETSPMFHFIRAVV